MEPVDIQELEKIILEKRSITHEKLETVLNFFETQNLKSNITCQHIHVKNTGDSIRERDFLHLIHQHIVMFVLDFDEYRNMGGLTDNELVTKFTEIITKAKSKFQTKIENTGEVGELILFLLLEANGITQIMSKMRIKSNAEMSVFGTDAIHIQSTNDELIFHFGESKMYDVFTSAVDSAVKSIENTSGKQEDMEFDIISKNIDRSKFGEFTDQILDYLNPYLSNKENMKTSYPILICHNWNILQDLTKRNGANLSEYLKKEYEKSSEKYSTKIVTKVTSSKINNKTFNFFVIPFTSVSEFRKSFLEML